MAIKVEETQTLISRLECLRDDLYPIAKRATLIFAIIRSMSVIRNEYQFTLYYFLALFDEAIHAFLAKVLTVEFNYARL